MQDRHAPPSAEFASAARSTPQRATLLYATDPMLMPRHELATREPIAAYLISDVSEIPGWRERVMWPVPVQRLNAVADAVLRRTMLRLSEVHDEFVRHLILVAAGRIAKDFVASLELALLIQAEADGVKLFGLPRLGEAFRDEAAEIRFHHEARGGKGIHEVASVPWASLRASARAATWSRWYHLPSAMLRPETVAVSHNALLRDLARRSRRPLGFRHAHNLVVRARKQAGPRQVPDGALDVAAELIQDWLSAVPELRDPYARRLRNVVTAGARRTIERVGADVIALRHSSGLPRRIWSGTTGAYTTRLVSAEVRRRGGEVVNFDHGGVTAISQLPAATAFTELTISSRFVVGTREWAELLRKTDAPKLAGVLNRAEIGFAHGDPTFRRRSAKGRARHATRPRVLYIGHPFRGFRQSVLPDPADTLYWDFQIRVIEALRRLAIELVCKPHPEGIYVGQRNPIEQLAPTSYKRFEDHLDDTDIFVFDAPTSTTFGEALCTDRPVVLLDRGVYPINPALEPMIRARCRVVRALPDHRQSFAFDPDALADAVATRDEPDPTYFRRLLAGDGSVSSRGV